MPNAGCLVSTCGSLSNAVDSCRAEVPSSQLLREDCSVPSSSYPLLPFLADLESAYVPDAKRQYDPAHLVAFALAQPASDYWAALAISWLEQGVPSTGLENELRTFEDDRLRAQALRHRARRLRQNLT